MFSDFDKAGEIWVGTGPRERHKRVTSKEKFVCPPAKSVGQPRPPTSTFFKKTGNNTKKAAPAKLPKIEPKPPMMIMNNTKNDLLMPNTSPTSTAPR